MQHQQPRLHPQLVEVTVTQTIVHFRRNETPVVETAVQSMKKFEDLKME
jgi:hypothetical protein